MSIPLPESTHVGAVTLQVSDLARSTGYYEKVLGMRVISRDDGGAHLGPHGDDTVLLSLRELPGATPMSRRGRLGLYHFAVLLPDRPALGRSGTPPRWPGGPTFPRGAQGQRGAG